MSVSTGSKINRLFEKWPQNLIATTPWLHLQGVSDSLIQRYVESSWLKRIGTGAYFKVGDHLDWMAAIEAIQSQLKLEIHVGAESALELHGVMDQVPQSKIKDIYLYGTQRSKLPKWAFNEALNMRPHFSQSGLFSKEPVQTFFETKINSFKLKIASRERAILELLAEVPQKRELQSVQALFIQLSTLRPKVIQSHLECCKSFKVKRLFLYLAREANHAWYKEINKTKINLGVGKKVIEPNGVFDAEYLITVPRNSEVSA